MTGSGVISGGLKALVSTLTVWRNLATIPISAI